ncbi:MAG: uncharacterized protein KVP18_004643, partial [Porospora cf. gigantea A]
GAVGSVEHVEEVKVEDTKTVETIEEAGEEIPETEGVEHVKELEEEGVEQLDSQVSKTSEDSQVSNTESKEASEAVSGAPDDIHLRFLATWVSIERLLRAHPNFDQYRNKYIRSKVACGRARTYADIEQLLKERHQPVDKIFLLSAMSRLSWFDWETATTPLKQALDTNGVSLDVRNYLAGNLYKNYRMSKEIHPLGQFLLSQLQDAKPDGIYLAVAFDACTQAYNYYKHNKIL